MCAVSSLHVGYDAVQPAQRHTCTGDAEQSCSGSGVGGEYMPLGASLVTPGAAGAGAGAWMLTFCADSGACLCFGDRKGSPRWSSMRWLARTPSALSKVFPVEGPGIDCGDG